MGENRKYHLADSELPASAIRVPSLVDSDAGEIRHNQKRYMLPYPRKEIPDRVPYIPPI